MNTNTFEQKRFKVAALDAGTAYAAAKPWEGTNDEKEAKLQDFVNAVCDAYGVDAPEVLFEEQDHKAICEYVPSIEAMLLQQTDPDNPNTPRHKLHMKGKFSVLVLMLSLGRNVIMPRDEVNATRWAVGLFKRSFPASYAKRFQRPQGLLEGMSALLMGSLHGLTWGQLMDIKNAVSQELHRREVANEAERAYTAAQNQYIQDQQDADQASDEVNLQLNDETGEYEPRPDADNDNPF